MATLVLSAAGAAVGGPVGSVVGSFLGQQIDRSLGRGNRARLSDLRAPSAQYGDPIPQVLRRMRVAGVVLWSAAPVATATVSKSGTTQGSSVSFAYGLSSGRVDGVARIWADGRLIRDAGGRQATAFAMRLHHGDEDQLSDPLIASVLGETQAPAFRGIAYLVFENFDLSTFGNRLPLITVELTSEGAPLTAEEVIRDNLRLGGGVGARVHELEGVALVGDDQAAALSALQETFEPTFAYGGDGWCLEQSSRHHLIEQRLWLVDDKQKSRSEIAGKGDAPTKVSLRYFDPAIDYAGSEKTARLPGPERLKRIELAAAMSAEVAKAAAFERLASEQSNQHSWLRLPLSFARIGVGDQVSCAGTSAELFVVCEKIVAAGELWLRLRRPGRSVTPLAAEAGGVAGAQGLGRAPLSIALVEMPGQAFTNEPEVGVLVSGGSVPFTAMPLVLSSSGMEQESVSAALSAPQGKLSKSLPPGPADLLDRRNVIEAAFDEDPILTSCDEASLLSGANLICVNGEFLQFGVAEPLPGGSYRLSNLIRGRFDSAAASAHLEGSPILLVDAAKLTRLSIPRERIGGSVSVEVLGPDASTVTSSLTVTGQAAQPWAPTHLEVGESGNALQLSWVRRCKEGSPWLDFVDAPLGSSREAYLVQITDAQARRLEFTASTPSLVVASAELGQLGPRPWRVEVRQLGDFGAGRPCIHIIE